MTELADLVKAEAERTSYPRMRQRAARSGFQISVAGLHAIGSGKVARPRRETLPAIAAALGMTERQVKEAAARQSGVWVEHDVPFRTGQMLAFVEEMSSANRERWFRLAQAIARELAEEEKVGAPRTVITTDTGGRPDAMTERRVDQELQAAEQRALQGRERRRRQG